MKYDPYSKDFRCTYFDIETLGLSAKEAPITVATFLRGEEQEPVSYFAESPEEEPQILSAILREFAGSDAIITYNGNSFDIPFVYRRLAEHGLAYPRPFFRSMDVYRLLRRYWPGAKKTRSLTQKSVESILCPETKREDRIGGRECIRLYNEYVISGREELKSLILLHNREDVLMLRNICDRLHFLPYHRIASENGFMMHGETSRILMYDVNLHGGFLIARGQIENFDLPAYIYRDESEFQSGEDGRFTLKISCEQNDGYMYVDAEKMLSDSGGLSHLPGYRSGFIVLAEGGKPLHREMNALTVSVLKAAV